MTDAAARENEGEDLFARANSLGGVFKSLQRALFEKRCSRRSFLSPSWKLSSAARTYLRERLNTLDQSGQRGVLPPPPPPLLARLLVVLPPRPPSPPSSSCRGSFFAAPGRGGRSGRSRRREACARQSPELWAPRGDRRHIPTHWRGGQRAC